MGTLSLSCQVFKGVPKSHLFLCFFFNLVFLSGGRTQRLEKVKQALLEEIGNLEQDDNALKSMEKELTVCITPLGLFPDPLLFCCPVHL